MDSKQDSDYFCGVNSDLNKIFGRKVAELRLEQHLSQEELADRCGIHRTYMGAIERGEKSPTLNTIKKIADGLKVPIRLFFTDDTK